MDVRVARNYARALIGLMKWALVALAGGIAAVYGAPLVQPAIEAAMKLLK